MQQINSLSNDSVNASDLNQTANLRGAAITCKSLVVALFCGFSALTGHASEIVFTDSQAAVLSANAGSPAVIASGVKLMQPFGIAAGQSEFFVSDTGCLGILGINRLTGEQRLVCNGGILGVPFGIALEQTGDIVVANGQAVLRVNPQTGTPTVISPQGPAHPLFRVPLAVAVAANGDIFVADAFGPIFRVDAKTGEQTLISHDGYLQRPQGIAVNGNTIYVTDVATSDMNFGVGRIIQINTETREQSLLSEGNYLVGPVGIAIEESGHLVVGDPYTINQDSADLFDGAIIHVNKNTGAQKLIARGSGNFVNPRGVAVLQSGQ